MNPQAAVDLAIISALTKALDALASACMDERGDVKAPSKLELIEARKMLPRGCLATLVKDAPTQRCSEGSAVKSGGEIARAARAAADIAGVA